MTHREILELRRKIETEPILTDEEIDRLRKGKNNE